VQKLLDDSFIKEHYYPYWLAIVMFKEPHSSYRICVNYIDLNKACPKDFFPLLKID